MGRLYTALECGCLISCNGGGGLMPCDTDGCVASEYMEQHKSCEHCGECMTCNPYHCLMGAINHSCEWWDLCVDGLDGIKNRIARIEYCPWCGEKLELKEGNDRYFNSRLSHVEKRVVDFSEPIAINNVRQEGRGK